MADYKKPGVYVEELPASGRPISAASSSVTAFLGAAQHATAAVGTATGVKSFSEYCDVFHPDNSQPAETLTRAVRGFFDNGGSRAVIVRISAGPITPQALEPLEDQTDVSLLAAPGITDQASQKTLLDYAARVGSLFVILDAPLKLPPPNQLSTWEIGGDLPDVQKTGLAAIYAPWVLNAGSSTASDQPIPPSGHVAGLYARVDADLGVHKAPASLPLRGVTGLTHHYSDDDQAVLQEFGLNPLRDINSGIRVWGARTLADPTSLWKDISMRRTVLYVEQSLKQGLAWAIFEPNDQALWDNVRRDVTVFLNTLWRQGALRGETPEEAFFVKCGLDTMTSDDIDNGRLIVLIGLALLAPREFVQLTVTQSRLGG